MTKVIKKAVKTSTEFIKEPEFLLVINIAIGAWMAVYAAYMLYNSPS